MPKKIVSNKLNEKKCSPTLNDWDLSAESWDSYVKRFNVYTKMVLKLTDFAQVGSGMTVLDIGAATGLTSRVLLHRIGPTGELYLNDISPKMLSYSKKVNFKEKNVHFIKASALELKRLLPKQKFDRIISNLTFYHIDNRPSFLSRIRELLKNDGIFCFSLHNGWFHFSSDLVPKHWKDPFHEEIKKVVKERSITFVPAKISKFNKDQVENILEESGFREARKPLIFQVPRTMEDRRFWLKIPGISFQVFGPNVPISVRNEIIDRAFLAVKNQETLPTTIICFCYRKK